MNENKVDAHGPTSSCRHPSQRSSKGSADITLQRAFVPLLLTATKSANGNESSVRRLTIQLIQFAEGRLGPDDEAAQVASRSQLQ